jgi:hypothetical protein
MRYRVLVPSHAQEHMFHSVQPETMQSCGPVTLGGSVGAVVGDGVGNEVGMGVGAALGKAVGAYVGTAVGTLTHSVAPAKDAVHAPTSHAWHSWYAVLSWYLPLGQWKQLVAEVQAV